MSARGMPPAPRACPAKRVPSLDSVRSKTRSRAKLQSLSGFKRPSATNQMAIRVSMPKTFSPELGSARRFSI